MIVDQHFTLNEEDARSHFYLAHIINLHFKRERQYQIADIRYCEVAKSIIGCCASNVTERKKAQECKAST